MKTNNVLKKIKMEISIIAEKNKFYNGRDNITREVDRIKESYECLNETVGLLEEGGKFLQKLEIKKDLKKILKLFVQDYSDDSFKIFSIRCAIDKLNAKYKVKYSSKMPQRKENVENNVKTTDDEEYKNELQDKIARIRKKVEEDKSVNGIHCDEPVQTFSIAEVRETAERQARIKHAMKNAKISREKQAEQLANEDRVVQEISEKIRRIKQKKEKIAMTDSVDTSKSEIHIDSELKDSEDSTHSDESSTKTRGKRKLPWYTTIPVVGALAVSALSGIAAVFNHNTGDKDGDKYHSSNNSYSDSINSTEGSEDMENVSSHRASNTNVQTTQYTTVTDIQQNESKTTVDSNVDELGDDLLTEEPVIVNIADKINVPNGLRYTSDCLGGGNSNEIGAVSWRPATEYSIDNVAFCYNGKILGTMKSKESDVKQQLNNYANQYHINVDEINTSVLLSLVPGNGDTGWAQISIDEMERNVCKQMDGADRQIHKYDDHDIDR